MDEGLGVIPFFTEAEKELIGVGEQLIILQGLRLQGEQVVLIAGASSFLVLGIVVLLLFISERTRARCHEQNSHRKLGHEYLPWEKPDQGLREILPGKDRSSSRQA